MPTHLEFNRKVVSYVGYVDAMDKGVRKLEPGLVVFLVEWTYILRLQPHHFILELGACCNGLGWVPKLVCHINLVQSRPLMSYFVMFLEIFWNKPLGFWSGGELNYYLGDL